MNWSEQTPSSNSTRDDTLTSPDGQYWNQTDYILCGQRWRSSIQSAKIRWGVDCGSHDELLIANFRLKLKKVGKITRPFSYDLSQIPFYYSVEVTNRFKGLDLIDRMPMKNYEERFMKLCRRPWSRPSPRKKMQVGKMVVWGGLTNSWKKKRSKSQRRKGKIYTHLNAEFQRIERDKKTFLNEQCKEMEVIDWEWLEISSRTLKIPREHFMQIWTQ